jgi:hypothetical protein
MRQEVCFTNRLLYQLSYVGLERLPSNANAGRWTRLIILSNHRVLAAAQTANNTAGAVNP